MKLVYVWLILFTILALVVGMFVAGNSGSYGEFPDPTAAVILPVPTLPWEVVIDKRNIPVQAVYFPALYRPVRLYLPLVDRADLYNPYDVPFYSQIDPRWDEMKMCCGCSCTFFSCGCALSSVAMVLSYYGFDLNPVKMNNCLGAEACRFPFEEIPALCTNNEVEMTYRIPFSWEALEQHLANGPVLGGLVDGSPNKHMVVIVSGSGDKPKNYFVHDPAFMDGAFTNLKSFYDDGYWLHEIIIYRPVK